MAEDDLLKKYNRLYLEILMRYKEDIEKGERLYVAELPKLVMPNDETVLAVVKGIQSAFPNYSFDQDFYDAARQAYKYVTETISTINTPIEFWLKPSQVISIEAGDVLDKAVLLCSMLISLGNLTSKVISLSTAGDKSFSVYCEFKDKLLLFDMHGGMTELQNKEELVSKMNFPHGPERIAYEFNDNMYDDLI